jgi:hypothetical protein
MSDFLNFEIMDCHGHQNYHFGYAYSSIYFCQLSAYNHVANPSEIFLMKKRDVDKKRDDRGA